ncbi:restriction endonuclease subunit S [Salmonella enterica]|uniref:Restriction endonuclease subunit S n=3 Tax=Salmonella enterica TaxID=28901 RepID=A0A5V1GVH8_SALER|nr:restriction endonuclease subunit S [Salmonella enterica]ECU9077399.1 restriction endonuclease subunit S [Salmonella enterica subsp. enterica serovar O rough]ECZ3652926.1 restriction endonuclease subunit S [Salmonella enterica subsp. enterica serovar Chailey]EDQ4688388.1 restriction endonuclease subunit S [Salmonella enterica subsp. enterica serovar Stanleyville]MBJ5311890.1 restriction endonuclease subunit S [Salmonella enterica subsp. enterica serovar Dabou]AWD07801.1 restriction endonucle
MAVEKLIVDHIDTWTTALQTRSTAGRGSSGKIDLYGIKKLRELILELAVRGKLVPQDPNDEPASELLKRIAAEKAELVKQGKIKKQKPLPEISEEEKPFELPVGWEWVRLEDVTDNIHYGYTASADVTKKVKLLRITDIQDDKVIWRNVPGCEIKDSDIEQYQLQPNDIVIARTGGTVGKSYLVDDLQYIAVFASYLIRLKYIKFTNANYTKIFLGSQLYWLQLYNGVTGTGQPNVNGNTLKKMFFPLPPSNEQNKICSRVQTLLNLCDQLEQHSLTSLDAHQQLVETLLTTLTDSQNAEELAENWAHISEHFGTLFTTEASIDALKQTILQLAVMGKLVPQDPNDEPASELLKRIAQEKAQLVKDGKIKKQKPLPPISDEEKPFELPEGWEWSLFEDVVDIQSGITKGRNLANRKLISIPYLRVANVQRGYLDLSEVKEIDIPEEEKDKYHVIKGDLLITEGGDWDTVGRTTVWCHDWYIANQNHVFKGRIIGQGIDPYWLETYMNSPYSRDYFASASKQTTNLASINKTQLRGCPVAIPPSSEAEKIMLKLNDFNELCEKLKLQIQSAQQTQLHLADALTDAAIN